MSWSTSFPAGLETQSYRLDGAADRIEDARRDSTEIRELAAEMRRNLTTATTHHDSHGEKEVGEQ